MFGRVPKFCHIVLTAKNSSKSLYKNYSEAFPKKRNQYKDGDLCPQTTFIWLPISVEMNHKKSLFYQAGAGLVYHVRVYLHEMIETDSYKLAWAGRARKIRNLTQIILSCWKFAGRPAWLTGWPGRAGPGTVCQKNPIAALRVCIVTAVGTWHCKTEQKRFLAPNDVKSEAGHVSASQDSESETFSD